MAERATDASEPTPALPSAQVSASRVRASRASSINRRLASLAARKGKLVPLPGGGTLTPAAVADRREYNATGKIIYAFAGTGPEITGPGQFEFFIVSPDGNPIATGFTTTATINTLPPPDDCDLLKIRNGRTLKPGDILRARLSATPTNLSWPSTHSAGGRGASATLSGMSRPRGLTESRNS